MWFLYYNLAHWDKVGKAERVKFQQLLRRIEAKYILDFIVYKLKKAKPEGTPIIM